MLHSRLLAVLVVLAAGAALPAAAEVPPQDATPLRVNEPAPEQVFQQPNEVQWFKIDLERGKDYAIGGVHLSEEGPNPTLALFDAAGRQFLSFEMTLDYTDIEGGSEFRAPATATFFIKAENTGSVAPLSYFLAVEKDCRKGSTTKCNLPVGKTRTGSFNFTGDSDWHRVTARAGKRYTVKMSVDYSGVLSVRNRRGKVIGTCTDNCQIRFRAAYTGPYFVVADQEDENSANYTLRLTQP